MLVRIIDCEGGICPFWMCESLFGRGRRGLRFESMTRGFYCAVVEICSHLPPGLVYWRLLILMVYIVCLTCVFNGAGSTGLVVSIGASLV